MKGIFGVLTAEQLLEKLRFDLERIVAKPRSPFPAIDFFITAESLIDWLFPDRPNKQATHTS
ncbi:MAG: hypothetical protein RIC55_32310 [Pirellulaceae bacterium]